MDEAGGKELTAVLKWFSRPLAVVAGLSVLAGTTIPGASGRAQDSGPEAPASPEASSRLVEETLIARGNTLLEAGDFTSARLLYQAAANQGSARAAMLTGVTFDPRYRELAGVAGPPSDARLARQWYALAERRGDAEARRNDLELVEWLKGRNIDPDGVAETDTTIPGDPVGAAETAAGPEPDEASTETAAGPEPDEASTETAAGPKPDEASTETAGPKPDEAPAETATPTAPAETPPPQSLSAADAGPAEDPAEGAKVVRAQLTSAVRDREPVDRLPQSIQVSDGGVDRILFFSEVRDLAGQTLSHRWERLGEIVAEVSFAVGSSSWRMHSSKRVSPAMTGAWRVVVVDDAGTELASVPFVLE